MKYILYNNVVKYYSEHEKSGKKKVTIIANSGQ